MNTYCFVEGKTIYTTGYRDFVYSCLDDLMRGRCLWDKYTNADKYKLNISHLLTDLSYSIYYRKLLKEKTVKEIACLLLDESVRLRRNIVNRQTFETQIAMCKDSLADYSIVRLSCSLPIVVNGKIYNGIGDLMTANSRGDISSMVERFPCFDDVDYDTEDRYYRNYWFCGKDSEAWKTIEMLEAGHNHCYLSERLSKEALPMVYYVDGESTMLFAF